MSQPEIHIIQLDASYKGKTILFSYESKFHYKARLRNEGTEGFGIAFHKERLPSPITKSFEDTLFEDWRENPALFGCEVDGKLRAFLELDHEKWNKRLRITNIWVEEAFRRQGFGMLLLKKAHSYAKENGARALILETQSCNHPAISFYLKNGFTFLGCDVSAYSNYDIEKHEVRIEMGQSL